MLNRNSLAVFSFLFPLLGGAPLLAGNVYVMPSIGTTLAGYGSEALNPIGSIVLPSRPVQVIPATDGTKAFVRGNAPIAAISVADANLTVVKKQFDLATAPEAAVLTPDGKRLLVLAGDLAIFDADTETQVDTGEPISVGADPNDLVVSHDSRYAYVLSTTSRQVTRVDQLTFALTGSALALPGTPYHVSIAPNGNIWVSATNEVLEIDPLFMRLTGKQIKLSEPNSVPGKLDFTSDGRKAVLVTSLPGNRSSLLYLDLDKSTVIGGVRNLAEGLDEIVFLENQQKVLARTETSKLYTVKLTDFSYSEATFGGQKLSNVLALAGSLEPTPAAAFAVTGASATPPLRIYRINTATFVIAADAPAPDSPGEVAYGGPVLGPPGGAISIYSGNGQLVPSAWASAKPLVVQVLDRNGNPSRDIEVKWEIKAPATGVLVPVTGSDGNRTDENGLARMNYRGGAIFDSSTTSKKDIVTATALESSVDFVVTTYRTLYADGTPAAGPIRKVLEPPAGKRLLSGGAGTVIKGAFEIQVLSGAKPDTGKPMSDVGVEIINASDPDRPPAAQCVGGYALTGNNGIAVCDLKVGGDLGKNPISVQVGGGVSFTDYYIEITPGPPAIVQKLEGDNQIGDPGQTLPIDLKAKITDLFGNPSEGVDVTWEVDPKGAATLIGETRKTDAEGGVSAKVRLGNVAGTHQIIVRSGDAVAAFRVTVNIALGSLQKVSGDLQSALIGQPFSQPLRVKAIDDQGQPLGNIVVAFNRTAGEGDLSAASATTDQNGEASITVVAGQVPGSLVVEAAALSFKVTFNLTVLPPGPHITVDSFVDAAGFRKGVSPGAIVSIIGPGLAPGILGCLVPNLIIGPLPYSLGQVEVAFNGILSPIYSVCNSGTQEQVTIQVPFEVAPGTASVTVRVGGGSTTLELPVSKFVPGIFETVLPDSRKIAVLMRPDGTYVGAQNPAHKGEIITMFMTGLGAVNPVTGTNVAGIGGQTVVAQIIVGINNEGVRVVSKEYFPGMVGLYIVRFEVPQSAPSQWDVKLSMGVVDGDNVVYGNDTIIPIL